MDIEPNQARRVIKALIANYFNSSDESNEVETEEIKVVFTGTNSRIRRNPDVDFSCA